MRGRGALTRVGSTDDVAVHTALLHRALHLAKQLLEADAALARDQVRRRDATHAMARARAAHPSPHVVGVGAGGQEVDLVRNDNEGVGGADDGGEVGREGAVEVEEVDHRDDQAAAAREALE